MITSDGFVVPVNSDGHFRSLAFHVTQGAHTFVGGEVIPVGRTESYRRIMLPKTVSSPDVYTVHTDRETAIDSSGPIGALWSLFTSPDAGDEVVIETRKFVLPVRILMEGFVGPVNDWQGMQLSSTEAKKREESTANSYAESKRQLERDLTRIVTPDSSLFDTSVSRWLSVALVVAVAVAVTVIVRRR